MTKGIYITIRTKLIIFAISIVILFAILFYGLMIPMFEEEKHREREATLLALVNSTVSLMEFYEDGIRKKKYLTDLKLPRTRAEAKQRVLNHIRQSRFGRGEHFFILNGNATMIMHPLKPETEHKNMADVSAPNGGFPFYEMAIKAQRDGTVFIKYLWLSKWSMTVYEPQTTCAKYFYPWDWVVCTSTYTQDITDAITDIKRRATFYLIISSIACFMVIYFIGHLITRPIVQLAKQVHEIGKNSGKDQPREISVQSSDEVGQLSTVFQNTFRRLQTTLTELEKQEEKYRVVIENASDAIVIAQDGIITFSNQRTIDLFGYSADELRSIPFINIVHPNDRGKVIDFHRKRLSGQPHLPDTYSIRLITKDKKEKIIQLNPVLINWSDRPATLNFIRDITELKRLEEKYLQAQKMEAIGALAGGVAHDLNNILSGIKTYPELLLLKLPEDNPHRSIVSSIYDSGKKAAAIVQDLLTLARRSVDVSEVTNLNNLITDYTNSPEFSQLAAANSAVSYKVNMDESLANIQGSPIHLIKTIMNLVTNATEAIPQNGLVEIITENQELKEPPAGFSNFHFGHYAVLKISDTGSGIPPEILNKVFEPFITKKEMGRSGTGLGLSIVWGTIQDHNGHIEVESSPSGTTFTLYFPVTEMQIPSSETKPISEYTGNGEKILVVDDSASQRDITYSVLDKLEYTPHAVESGEKAIQYLQENEVDLVLLDMIMEPGIDGLETYTQIIKNKPQQKVVIVSGFSETERVKHALKLGALKYIQKPYTIEGLGSCLKESLE